MMRRPPLKELLALLDELLERAVEFGWRDQWERSFEAWLIAYKLALALDYDAVTDPDSAWTWLQFDGWLRAARTSTGPRAQSELLTARLASFGQAVRQ